MATSLQSALKVSTLLTPEMRQVILAAIPKLSVTQIQKITTLLLESENQARVILRQKKAKEEEINQQYLKKIKHFFQFGLPIMMRDFEQEDKTKEEVELDGLLSKLENI
ncbi:MAG: hypothetical protein UT55_C0081G0006 [Candidatus Peregrinibacteria bacterium GW2011_GWE2_39_6]|nr:MAG: hypothetical protein UT36_C0001G0048 [Candidatus Peregrinibacteria bacterium GW2011_GWF2_39_17]KKR23853.1 MAG: hypothetical protein UT55_C0081G0006 [Candidatus Peregrinibacteria bacterium GW2011_GWE2_39_6]HCW32390.1 hypothetical protein [Candidatus Peregrinibacteria bacterium]